MYGYIQCVLLRTVKKYCKRIGVDVAGEDIDSPPIRCVVDIHHRFILGDT